LKKYLHGLFSFLYLFLIADKALQSEEKKKWAKISQSFKKLKKERER